MIVGSAYFGVDIIDSLIDLKDFKNPIKPQIYTSYSLSSAKIHKEVLIFLKRGKISTDKGWLLEENAENEFLKVDREREFSKDINEVGNSKHFARLFFRMTNMQEIYQRKYDKIQDVAANIGKSNTKARTE